MTPPATFTVFVIMTCRTCGQEFIHPRPRGGRRYHCYAPECERLARLGSHARPKESIRVEPDRSSKVTRACLKCGSEFLSWGKANRICPTCDQENNQLTRTYSDLALVGKKWTAI